MISSFPRLISEARASASVSMYSRMFVTLPFRTVMAKTQSSSNVLFVNLTLPLAKPTTRTRSPCATNSGGSFHRVGSLLKQICQSRVPAVRAGQRPVLARNDPLNVFGRQRQQTLPVAAAHCCKKILHNLDILLNAHEISPFPYIGSRDVFGSADIDAKLLQHYGRVIVAMK